MPDITQSRNLPADKYAYKHTWDGKDFGNGFISGYLGSQTTTSYRSGPYFDDISGDSVVDATVGLSGLSARRAMNKALREEARSQYDTGHPFDTVKRVTRIMTPSQDVNPKLSGIRLRYQGPMYPQSFSESYAPTERPISLTRKYEDGRQAIAATTPTRPEAGLAQFLGEARERLPELIGFHTYRSGLKSAHIGQSNEYLNYQFGIRPMISDIQKMARVCADGNVKFKQYIRDSGRVVRRKRQLYDEATTSSVRSMSASDPVMGLMQYPYDANTVGNYFSRVGVVQAVDLFKETAWFSGAYSYHIDGMDNIMHRWDQYERKANHLLGSRLTPELVWELTPWSWLIDWQSDMGTLMKILTDFATDNLVLRYGYVMHRSEATRIWTQSLTAHGGQEVSCRLETSVVRKTRVRSTPYGFNVDLTSLSPRRWAILAALGMTKAPRTLR